MACRRLFLLQYSSLRHACPSAHTELVLLSCPIPGIKDRYRCVPSWWHAAWSGIASRPSVVFCAKLNVYREMLAGAWKRSLHTQYSPYVVPSTTTDLQIIQTHTQSTTLHTCLPAVRRRCYKYCIVLHSIALLMQSIYFTPEQLWSQPEIYLHCTTRTGLHCCAM